LDRRHPDGRDQALVHEARRRAPHHDAWFRAGGRSPAPGFRDIKKQQAASRLKSEYVFCKAIGGPLDRDNLMNRDWYPALKRARIRERTPYQTRHTFATLVALSAGEEIGWVARQLGHVNTEMVIRHYYRWIRNNTRQDGAALDKAAAQFGL